jgi:hypothetical protein
MWVALDERERQMLEAVVAIGLSDFGSARSVTILSLQLPKVGRQIEAGARAGLGDSYRRAFDLVAPVSGEIGRRSDADAERDPSRLNAYPYSQRDRRGSRARSARVRRAPDLLRLCASTFATRADYDAWTGEKRMT